MRNQFLIFGIFQPEEIAEVMRQEKQAWERLKIASFMFPKGKKRPQKSEEVNLSSDF